jgi:glycine oxidase
VPSLTPILRGGIEVPGDHHVDNRALLAALVIACQHNRVTFVRERVVGLDPGPAGRRGSSPCPVAELSDGSRLGADHVLVAAGVSTPLIAGMEAAGLPEIRPVKGHILRLGPTEGPPLLTQTVRALVHGRSIYLVPRPDKTLVVGATMEERGMDTSVRAGAVHELLNDARAIVPGIDELELLEAQAGLRPATRDNTPVVGWTDLPGVAVASGHFRNGILLAPVTAAAVVDLLGHIPDAGDAGDPVERP